MPSFGITNFTVVKSEENNITIIEDRTESGVNIFTKAGTGFSFKIKNNFSGYSELLLFKRNMNGKNSRFWDWNAENTLYQRFIHSIGLGINYNL